MSDDTGLIVVFGMIGGLSSTGAGAAYSWLVYGSSELYLHPPAMAVAAALSVLVGLKVNDVITWLMNPPQDFLPPRRGQR